MAKNVVIPNLTPTLIEIQMQMYDASKNAMRSTMEIAERVAKGNHKQLSNWQNDTGNLETSITGYVAGDNADLVYAHAGEINTRPNNSRRSIRGHYEPDYSVSPPIDEVQDKVIGVLHHYMTYSNRLPWSTQREDINITTLNAMGDGLLQALAGFLMSELP